MRIAFWISTAIIVYTYVGYPVLIWMLARFRPKPWMRTPIDPTLSIVMAVRNGATVLPQRLNDLLNLEYLNLREVIIVSDGSTDETASILSEAKHPRLKPVMLSEHSGKAVALNAGLEIAAGEIVLFIDIRPQIAPGAISELVSNFVDPTVGCVAGELIVHTDGNDASSAAVGGLYWRYEQWIRNSEARFDSPVGVYGGFYAARRELLRPFPKGIILDDMFQPLAIVRQGYRSVIDARARVYDVWPKTIQGEFERKVRTLAGNFQLLGQAPWILSLRNRLLWQFLSHKVLRLVVPYLALCALVSAALLARSSPSFLLFTLFVASLLAFALAARVCNLGGIKRLSGPLFALLTLNAAAVVGLYKVLFTRGPLWKIWRTSEAVKCVTEHERQTAAAEL